MTSTTYPTISSPRDIVFNFLIVFLRSNASQAFNCPLHHRGPNQRSLHGVEMVEIHRPRQLLCTLLASVEGLRAKGLVKSSLAADVAVWIWSGETGRDGPAFSIKSVRHGLDTREVSNPDSGSGSGSGSGSVASGSGSDSDSSSGSGSALSCSSTACSSSTVRAQAEFLMQRRAKRCNASLNSTYPHMAPTMIAGEHIIKPHFSKYVSSNEHCGSTKLSQ